MVCGGKLRLNLTGSTNYLRVAKQNSYNLVTDSPVHCNTLVIWSRDQ